MANLFKLILLVSSATSAIAGLPNEACNLGDLKENSEDSTKFFKCTEQGWKVMECPKGLEWNSTTNECEEPKCEESESRNARSAASNGYKVVCYFASWAGQRDIKYLPENIDPALCSHIIYSFASLDPNTLTIQSSDPSTDINNQFYRRVTSLKKNGVKVSLAIGGWSDSEGNKYSRLVNNPGSRSNFINSVISFISEHNFDGLDLDWEYPKCWQGDCEAGPSSDKKGFAALVQELSAAFKPKGWLLSAAVVAGDTADLAYDVPVLSRHLDFINIMAYDFRNYLGGVTGHHSNLFAYPTDTDKRGNADSAMNYWISKGADRKKLILGMPMYGRSFTLANNNQNGMGARTIGPGNAGEFSKEKGVLAYSEICKRVNQGWKIVRDGEGRIGPYAFSGNQWVGFDDQNQITNKANYITRMGLGGAMIWVLDMDDFKNSCNCETYPLLKAMNRVLRNYPKNSRRCLMS